MTVDISARLNSAHLSEEALDDLLIGLGSSESKVHVSVCEVCRGRVERFQSNLETFHQASLAWTEARPVPESMTRSVAKLRAKNKSRSGSKVFAPLGWAMAVALLLVLGLQVWNVQGHKSATNDVSFSSEPGDTESQIVQDNQLLESVHAALVETDVSTVTLYGLEREARDEPVAHRRHRSEVRNP